MVKDVDMATLGNLCVDIVLSVPRLPPASNKEESKAFLEQLAASAPDKKFWEAGGNCNLAIAASRLGLHVCTLGHVGNDIYGHFLLDVLQNEGINMVEMNENSEASSRSASYETTLCWVLVDPLQNHYFCSYIDFLEEPALSWITRLPESVKVGIQQSKIIFYDGYAFDELFLDVIECSLRCAIYAGAAVFFGCGICAFIFVKIMNYLQMDTVDTVGCGNSYNGAIAFGYLHDMTEINTLALANAVGAATATGTGAGQNVANLGKVLELLRVSNLSENDKFWSELLEENLENTTPINGYVHRFVHIPVQTVVSQLLSKFEANATGERGVL